MPALHSFLFSMKMRHYARMKKEDYPRPLKRWYFRCTGKTLDLANPRTINEKIQWMKLYDSTPLKTVLADKYKVRQWVAERIGDEHLIPLLGKWENADDIDFDTLPDRFVLKANHGAGWNIIVKDKKTMDVPKVRGQLNTWLKTNFAFLHGFQMHYKDIPPAVIAEEYIENVDGEVYDYKFLCFSGEPKYFWVDMGRNTPNHKRSIFDLNFVPQPFSINRFPSLDIPFVTPENYDKMVAITRILCEGFKFVRVDLYNVNGKIYFGEMTFTSTSGLIKIYPPEYATILGDMITL